MHPTYSRLLAALAIILLYTFSVQAIPTDQADLSLLSSTHHTLDLSVSHPSILRKWSENGFNYSAGEDEVEREIWAHPPAKPVNAGLRTFMINMETFSTTHCQKEGHLDPHHMRHVGEKEKCHSFPRPFNSYFAGWRDHQTWFEKPEDYGNCTIFEWEDDQCSGRLVGRLDNANLILPRSDTKMAECMGPFTDLRGKRGSAMSMKIVCDR